jgi:hypothetical protein
VAPEVAAKDYVAGILVRVAWKDLQPNDGPPVWTLLDQELALARGRGKKVALAVVNGPEAPAWLSGRGARTFSYNFRGSAVTMPVPWDAVYLTAWRSFIGELGQRYRDDPDLALVHATHSTANGFEMQLPFSPVDQQAWTSAGYTPERAAEAWNSALDAFAAAFPSKPIDVEVHPVLGTDRVAQDVAAHGHATLGPRFGVFAAWWSQRNATTVYPGMNALVQEASGRSYATVQMVAAHTLDPDAFGEGGFPKAVQLALDSGVRYLEVWNDDLTNTSLEPLLRQTAAAVTGP